MPITEQGRDEADIIQPPVASPRKWTWFVDEDGRPKIMDDAGVVTDFTGSTILSDPGAPAGGLGKVTDFYFNETNGDFYLKTGASTWTLQGRIRGATVYTGSGAPSGATGLLGDLYIRTNGDYYIKDSDGSWGSVEGSLQGPQGIQGDPGVVTTVTAGDGLTGGWSASTVTLHVDNSDATIDIAADGIARAAITGVVTIAAGSNTSAFAVDMATQAELDAHLADTVDAHDASAVSYLGASGLSATDVEAALDELDAEKQPLDATLTALAAADWVNNALPIGTGVDTLSQTAFAANKFPARASTGNLVAKDITDFALTLLDDANAAAARITLGVVNGPWIDVSQVGPYVVTAMSTGATGAQNNTRLDAIMAAAPSGSTLYFSGLFPMASVVAVPAKVFCFQGDVTGVNGALHGLNWTSNVGGDLITLTAANYYTTFRDMNFLSLGATQTAGAVVATGSNAGINFFRCNFSGLPSTTKLNSCINYTGAVAGLVSVIQHCTFYEFNGTAIFGGSNLSTVIVDGCTINAGQVTSTIGIDISIGGAFQISDCDIIGCNNNLRIAPTSPDVVASVFCINTYFDSSQGSCIKISGSGASVRNKFVACSFTTAASASPNNAVEVSTTFNYGVNGMGLDFVSCNILNTFGTIGTGTGLNITGGADFSVVNCNIAAWGVGIDVTPAVANDLMQPNIVGNTIGPSGNYGANTIGVRFNNGSFRYGPMFFTNNVMTGNTTNLVDSVTTQAPLLPNEKQFSDNLGLGKDQYCFRTTVGQTVSGTTMADATGFSFPLVQPNLKYAFEFFFPVNLGAAGNTGLAVLVSAPTSATIQGVALGTRHAQVTAANATVNSVMTAAASTVGVRVSGVVVAGTATSHTGIVQLRLSAQSSTTTGAGSATIHLGGYVNAFKVQN